MKTDWIAGLLGPWSAELAPGSILLRLALSMALAAIIGCERSSKRHSAGLRTFILVSLAGTATMLIDQYLMDVLPITIPLLSAAAVIGMTSLVLRDRGAGARRGALYAGAGAVFRAAVQHVRPARARDAPERPLEPL